MIDYKSISSNECPEWISKLFPSDKDYRIQVINALDAELYKKYLEKFQDEDTDELFRWFLDLDPTRFIIFVTGENTHQSYLREYHRFDNYMDNYPEVDFRIGFDYGGHENYFRAPLWYDYFEEDYEKYKSIPKDRNRDFCLIASHSGNRIRSRISDLLEKNGHEIHYYGKFRHNDDLLWNSKDDKCSIVARSIFNICPENSDSEGYVTEKLYEALASNTIPIYWGNRHIDDVFNKEKIIFFDLDNPQKALDEIDYLLNSPIELNRKLNLPPFTFDVGEFIKNENKKLSEMLVSLYNKKFNLKEVPEGV